MRKLITVFFILQLIIISNGNANSAIAAPTLSIDDYEIGIGETATIDILLSGIDATILNAFSFRVEFDPDGLTASNVTAGPIIPASTSFWFSGDATTTPGRVSFFYSPFMPNPPSITDDGILASFDVLGGVPGLYGLTITDLAFSDKTTPVEISAINGSVSVNAVPIPSALLLLSSGLVGLLGFRRKIKS